ncbi:hypothetical protein FG05_07605 [Fusarium graminearum]|nr:hypothetical protein FG05_07605 [Fusarium graminearum]
MVRSTKTSNPYPTSSFPSNTNETNRFDSQGKQQKQRNQKLATYVDNLSAVGMSGKWVPAGKWNKQDARRWQGEAPEYHVKIEEVVSKATVWINTYNDIPSFETVVEEVKAELGS